MFIVNAHESEQINQGAKRSTLRAIRPSGKGYFKVGSLQKVCKGRDFVNGIFNRVLILARYPVEIPQLTAGDFHALGYESKAEYMSQPYNQNNPSPHRIRYDFITLADLLEFVASLEITPANFATVWDMVKDCRELRRGVDPAEIFEGCDCETLQDAFIEIQANIEGEFL